MLHRMATAAEPIMIGNTDDLKSGPISIVDMINARKKYSMIDTVKKETNQLKVNDSFYSVKNSNK